MSIAVEDWDDLAEAPRRRGKRKRDEGPAAVDPTVKPRLTSPPPETTEVAAAKRISAAAEAKSWDDLEATPAHPAAQAPAPAKATRRDTREPAPARVAEQAPAPAEETSQNAPEPTPARPAAPMPNAAKVTRRDAPEPAPVRAITQAPVSAPTEVASWDTLEATSARAARRAPAPAPAPGRVLGLAQFEDDDYGEVTESLRVPAGLATANWLAWLVGVFGGVVECIGVAFFVSIGLLLAAYLTRETQRDRTALILLAGAIPLPLTIIGLFV